MKCRSIWKSSLSGEGERTSGNNNYKWKEQSLQEKERWSAVAYQRSDQMCGVSLKSRNIDNTIFFTDRKYCHPGWCGSVDWAWFCEPEGRWFDSQSGHVPGLRAWSPVGSAWRATTHWCFFPSISLSLTFSLKINT